jgi:hypothetical protein
MIPSSESCLMIADVSKAKPEMIVFFPTIGIFQKSESWEKASRLVAGASSNAGGVAVYRRTA